MAQRVVAAEDVTQREESTYDLESEETDAITLNDTEDSQYDEDASWPLDYILAEADTDESDTDGNTTRVRKYLVKWTGYSKAKATWQKRADFVGDAETVFFAWQENRMREVRGHRDEFDLGAYQRYLDAIKHAKERRHEKRNKKRRKLKLEQVNYDAEDDADDEEEPNDDRGTAQAARGDLERSSESRAMELDDSSDDEGLNSDRPTARVGALRVNNEPAPYKGTMRPPTSRGRMPFAHSPSSAGSPVSTRSPSVDSSRRHAQAEPPLKRRRRTNSEIERDDEQTKALQRKKGIAVSKKPGTNTSAPASRSVPSKTKTINKPTAPKAGSFFDNLQKTAGKITAKKLAAETATTSAVPTNIAAAPVARMVGGPKQSKPKSVAQAAGSRPATNIFAPVPKKQRKASEPVAKFKNLSHQHAVFKKMREEPAPSIDQLQLINLQTGLPIARTTSMKEAPTTSSVNEPSILPTMITASASATHQGGTKATKPSTAQALREENDAFEAMRISSPADTEVSAIPMVDANKDKLGMLFTCYNWATRGSCGFGSDCYLEHYHTGEVAPPDNRISPSHITCAFWFHGSCFKDAQNCKFVHGVKRYLSQKTGPPIRMHHNDVKDMDMDVPATCWFWFFKAPPCRMSDQACPHVHGETMFVAPRTKDSGKVITYQDALMQRAKKLQPEVTLESAELGSVHSPIAKPRSPPPRARRGRDDDDDDEPIRTIINLPFQQRAAPTASEFKIRGRATRDKMHTISASLRMKQPHDQLKEFGVVLEFVGEATKASFLERAGTASQSQPLALDITSFCIAEMVRHYMDLNKQEICATGEIVPEDIDDSEVEGLFQTLRSHSGGAMVLNPEFSMLMFPTGQQTWDFWRLPKAGPGVKLQFVIMPHIQPLPKAKEPSYMTNAQPEQAPSSEIVLDHDRRFHANSRDRFVFLLFHPNYAEEIEALMTSLHKAGATVYLNNESGSWVQFTTKCDSGTIIVHPSFDDFHRIPNLASIANKPSFKFFNFGEVSPINAAPTFDLSSKPFVRLFPHGKAVFIMDSVFADQPQMAHAVVKELHPRFREAPSANCVLGRPDLLRWLQKHALDEPDEPAFPGIYALLATLLHASPVNLTTWPMPERPTSQSPVYFEPLFENPDYGARYLQTKEEAEEEMAEWFAMWALKNVQRYKSFVIVSLATNRITKNWMQKWNHLEVLNPMTFVAQLSKAESRKRDYEERQKKERAREKEREREKEKATTT